jgi:SNF2 family DNA or RNA helicase
MASCKQYKNITLQDYQSKLIDFITKPKNKSVLVFHSIGSGKTITSLAAAKCLLSQTNYSKVQIITNASLVSNFNKEIKKLDLDKEKKISVDSYGKFLGKMKKGYTCSNHILIIDESQGLNGDSSARFKGIFECAKESAKIILLSATPVKNSPEEFSKQLSLLTGKKIGKTSIEVIQSISGDVAKEAAFKKLVGCKVSYIKTDPKKDSNYPDSKKYIVTVKMDKDYYENYLKIQENNKQGIPGIFARSKNLAVFYNGIRRAVNKIYDVSPKISWAVQKTVKDIADGKKVMIYSNWLENGVLAVKRELIKKGIRVSEINGKMTSTEKDRSIDLYNKGIIKVILITSSGTEGLNLKETRTVIILEPHWNSSKIEQVTGRAIRYRSHSKLPESERLVEIFHLLLVKDPENTKKFDVDPSADQILFEMSLGKSRVIDEFYKNLMKVSIENDPECF